MPFSVFLVNVCHPVKIMNLFYKLEFIFATSITFPLWVR